MSNHNSRLIRRAAGAAAVALAFSAHALAVDPDFDSMRPTSGPTAGSPSQASRSVQRDIDQAPTLSQRFGLPRVSGPIPPILPPARDQPVFDSPDNAWPPPVERATRPGHDR